MSNLFARVQQAVSSDRIGAYRTPGDTDETVIARYLWNIDLSEALYPALQNLEIVLRNSVYDVTATTTGNPNWLDATPPILAKQDQDQVYRAKKRLILDKKMITAGRIVAELSFGFWTSLFDSRYDVAFWRRLLKPMFPDMPRHVRAHHLISKRLNRIRRLRNRVFHHEPVWRWADLHLQHGEILDTIGFISPCMKEAVLGQDRFLAIYAKGVVGYQSGARRLDRLFP